MRLVIDTNELFSFFNARSKARELSLLPSLELHAPTFALAEIRAHHAEIVRRFGLTETQFTVIEKLLNTVVRFSPEENYRSVLQEARIVSPDPDDIDFFALALHLNCPLWSEDLRLKDQKRIPVLSTKDLVTLIPSLG